MATWYDQMMAAAQQQQQIPPQDKYKAFTTPGWKPAANPLPADYVPPDGGPSLERLNSDPTWQLALNQLGGGISTIPNSGDLPLLLKNLLSGVQSMDTTGSPPAWVTNPQTGSPAGMQFDPYVAPAHTPRTGFHPGRPSGGHDRPQQQWQPPENSPYPWMPQGGQPQGYPWTTNPQQPPNRPQNPYTVDPRQPGPAQPIGGTPWTPPPGWQSETSQPGYGLGTQGPKPASMTGGVNNPWAPRAWYS
jgi:hypothetical protein